MYIFAKKHVSEYSLRFIMQYIYWDFLILIPWCDWPLISQNILAFRKRKMHLKVPLHWFLTHLWRVMTLKRALHHVFYHIFAFFGTTTDKKFEKNVTWGVISRAVSENLSKKNSKWYFALWNVKPIFRWKISNFVLMVLMQIRLCSISLVRI